MHIEQEPPTKLPVKRTSKSEMDPSNSLSADHLDDWIQPTFKTVLMPTVLDHYGAQEDPWTLEVEAATRAPRLQNDKVRTPFCA